MAGLRSSATSCSSLTRSATDRLSVPREPLFAEVSRRYERASLTVTSNRGFGQWSEILGEALVPPP
jgi:hypothetical protein